MLESQVPLTGLKTSGSNRKTVRNLDSTLEECAHTPKTRHWKQIETAWGSGQFPMTIPVHTIAHVKSLHQHLLLYGQLHPRARAVAAKGSVQL